MQCRFGQDTFAQIAVEIIHQFGAGEITRFPERRDHIVRTCAQEGPRKSDKSFSRVRARTCAVAGRNRDQISVKWMLNNVACIKLEVVTSWARARKDNRRVERNRTAGSGMSHEMDVRELLRLALQISSGGGIRA